MKRLKTFLILFFLAAMVWQCASDQEPIPADCAIEAPVLELASKTDANCGLADGSISLSAASLSAAASFTVNGVAQTNGNIQNLAAGSYVIVSTSAEGCTSELTVEILNADGVNATIETVPSECGNTTGRIVVNASGGTQPFEYKLGDGNFQASERFNALAPGDYEVTVRDGSGCEVVLQAEVKSDVTFANINAIIQTNCAVSGCHNGSQPPNFTSAANIQSSANRIQIRTGARTMPPPSSGRTLTDAEIEAIACWVADGASGD